MTQQRFHPRLPLGTRASERALGFAETLGCRLGLWGDSSCCLCKWPFTRVLSSAVPSAGGTWRSPVPCHHGPAVPFVEVPAGSVLLLHPETGNGPRGPSCCPNTLAPGQHSEVPGNIMVVAAWGAQGVPPASSGQKPQMLLLSTPKTALMSPQ